MVEEGLVVRGGGTFAGQTETVAAEFTLAFVCVVFGLLNELSSSPWSIFRPTTGWLWAVNWIELARSQWTYSRYFLGICLKRVKKAVEESTKMVGVLAKIQTGRIQSESPRRYFSTHSAGSLFLSCDVCWIFWLWKSVLFNWLIM
jgi:hypothetical protein